MTSRLSLPVLLGLVLLASGCDDAKTGALGVSVIGSAPRLANPNLVRLDAPSAFLVEATAQGLVRFDATGQVEPALAQSWIVSDDGLRYTFRLQRLQWPDGGGPITADQVVARLRAASSRSSRNPLKPLLGAIDEIEAMTEGVLEVRLRTPRPNFLQLLAQPHMAIIRNGVGSGPYEANAGPAGTTLLRAIGARGSEGEPRSNLPDIALRGERAALAVARFREGDVDLVTGGRIGDLPVARASGRLGDALRFDPVAGNLGLQFMRSTGALSDPVTRNALSMAIDRGALLQALNVPGLQPQDSLLPPNIAELPVPSFPAWSGVSQADRRATARSLLAGAGLQRLRVDLPAGPGYRLIFAHIRRDWRALGIEAVAVDEREPAELRLVDDVAPITLATWYLRRYVCEVSPICSAEADDLLAAARIAPNAEQRQTLLAQADVELSASVPYIPLSAPVRWSLVGPRATGFQPSAFARRFPGSLVAAR